MQKKRVTDLPIQETLDGFWIFGANEENKSVRVDMSVVQDAIDDANEAAESCDTATTAANSAASAATSATAAANSAASAATSAATAANSAASAATSAATAANSAASAATSATAAAEEATEAATSATEEANEAAELAKSAASLVPTSMEVEWPATITLSNLVQRYISATLYPEGTMQNVIFISDNKAVEVAPDGAITIVAAGTSKVHVIPTCNTALAKTIAVTVIERSLRMVTKSSLRLTASGVLRFN